MSKRFLGILFLFVLFTALFADSSAQGQVRYRKLAFKDEFNGAANSAIDTTKWTAEVGGGGWGNQELEYYTNSTDNAYIDGAGSLVIKAVKLNPPLSVTCRYGPCHYTWARLITKGKFEQKYGKIEARIKVPRGKGMWPAFWMLGNNIDTAGWPTCGEIDILENIGREPTIVHGTVHGPGYSGGNGIGAPYSLPNNDAFADDFHVYSKEWSQNKISFYVDGVHFKTITPADLPQGATWAFDRPFFMILNFAVGGGWPWNPDNTSVFPQTMMVDYVRVYKR
ncbi:MAG: glycoside hydrolase family 16 protein [Acidobacteria bacterium]|nr:glycoside hydrolase family 16 protein [Acidobacteriota bacterium]